MAEPSAARKFFATRFSDSERELIEKTALNAGLAPATWVREASLAMAGVVEAEDRLRQAQAELAEARADRKAVETKTSKEVWARGAPE